MLKSSLLEIIRSFSEEEIRRFEDFVRSPYFNKIKNVERLFLILRKHYPELKGEEAEKEKVWQVLFPGKKYNYGTMKNLIHELTKLCEKFIVTENQGKRELKNYHYLMDLLFDRGVTGVFNSKLGSLKKIEDRFFLKNNAVIEEDFYDLANIYCIILSSVSYMDKGFSFHEERKKAAELMAGCLLIYVFKIHCNLNVFSEYNKKIPDKNLLDLLLEQIGGKGFDELIKFSSAGNTAHMKIITAYLRMYKTIGDSNSLKNYRDLKESILDASQFVKGRQLFDLLINLRNSLNKLGTKAGNQNKEYFELDKLEIMHNCVVNTNGLIEDIVFARYVLGAFSMKKDADIRQFIDEYAPLLDEGSKESCINFANACICFLRSDHGASLECIAKVNINSPVLKVALKDLQIMNYYEMNDYESFLYVMDTYKHQLKYKNKPLILKNLNYAFCLKVKELFELKTDPDQYELRKLADEENKFFFMSRIWFDEKVKELMR